MGMMRETASKNEKREERQRVRYRETQKERDI